MLTCAFAFADARLKSNAWELVKSHGQFYTYNAVLFDSACSLRSFPEGSAYSMHYPYVTEPELVGKLKVGDSSFIVTYTLTFGETG